MARLTDVSRLHIVGIIYLDRLDPRVSEVLGCHWSKRRPKSCQITSQVQFLLMSSALNFPLARFGIGYAFLHADYKKMLWSQTNKFTYWRHLSN